MSNRKERRKNRMESRIARLFELSNMAWLAPNVVEAWPDNLTLSNAEPSQRDEVDGLFHDAIYIRMHGTSYTVTYKRGVMEWTGNKLRDAAKLFKASRLLVV